jgi:hypothetical protein
LCAIAHELIELDGEIERCERMWSVYPDELRTIEGLVPGFLQILYDREAELNSEFKRLALQSA